MEIAAEPAAEPEGLAFPLPSFESAVLAARERTMAMFAPSHAIAAPEPGEGMRLRVASKLLDDYRSTALRPKMPAPSGVPAATAITPAGGQKLLTAAAGGPLLMLADRPAAGSVPGTTSTALILRDSSIGSSSSSSAAAFSAGGAALGAGAPAGGGFGSSGSVAAASSAPALGGAGGAMAAVDDVAGALASRMAPKGVSAESMDAFAKAAEAAATAQATSRTALARRAASKVPTPAWHAPWKLMRVISGHLGWVRCVAVDPGNEWFATGAADRTVKIWDLASGTLKLTLTGHINTVRGLAVSPRHPYLFSVGEDKMVKCWDLEANRVVRSYHGHLSGVYCVALHPTLDILFTGGRDSVCRVWDMRTKAQIHVLGGHEQAVGSVLANSVDPQVITGAMDNTVRLWDLAAGKVRTVLTHHKKAVRSLVSHPKEFTFVSGAADSLRKWALPDGVLVSNLVGHNAIVNAMAVNEEGVLVSAGDDGSMKFWDYSTGYSFQELQTTVQPGSLDSEAGIYGMAFDMSGSRLITAEADKTIKIYREDDSASEESHPIDMAGWTAYCRAHKTY